MKKNIVLLASAAMMLASCGGAKTQKIVLTKNHDGKEVSILHERTQAYIDAMYEAEEDEDLEEEDKYKMRDNACGTVNPADYQGPEGDNDQDHFVPIKLEWNLANYSGSYKVKYATNSELENAKELVVTTNKAELVNLFTDTTYYWKVETADGAQDSQVGSFHTKGHYRMMESGLAYNVRDFGGKMTKSGRRIKQGLIYRGGELTEEWFDTGSKQKHIITLDANTKDIFLNTMKIKTDLDFRAAGPNTNNIDTSPLNHDLGDDDTIKEEAEVVWNNQACGSLTGFWTQQQGMLNNIFKTFMNATEDEAVYCHCWGGADRTGTAFFLLEGLLGVSYTECLMDYELTSFDNIHLRRRNAMVTDMNGFNYNFPDLTNRIKQDYPNWKTMDFSEICADWLEDHAGFSKTEIEQLKENLLEPEE